MTTFTDLLGLFQEQNYFRETSQDKRALRVLLKPYEILRCFRDRRPSGYHLEAEAHLEIFNPKILYKGLLEMESQNFSSSSVDLLGTEDFIEVF